MNVLEKKIKRVKISVKLCECTCWAWYFVILFLVVIMALFLNFPLWIGVGLSFIIMTGQLMITSLAIRAIRRVGKLTIMEEIGGIDE